jgi:hypothetical protein
MVVYHVPPPPSSIRSYTPWHRSTRPHYHSVEGGGGRGAGSSSSSVAAASSAGAATLSTAGPLPYDGDRDLNRALQRALGANDVRAMRILFQAQKARASLLLMHASFHTSFLAHTHALCLSLHSSDSLTPLETILV